ncbi:MULTISPECIES: DUF948 domain-containing protein [unclassified Leptolyngbya]|uniref:DUF948 domain-containing protein n=1 Tax=unclassified Leptolyngbya TaxID=2650499 RepID=UPI001F5490CB|nr:MULTISPECIES: DUF948 domain-containing protein [unclassified Leptolyngbya]
MVDPLFWLGLSLLLVAVSLTAVLMAALPALRELARAARSAEKLFDTLNRELPPTLEAIRLTGLEITDLTDEVSEGVQSAGRIVRQVDRSVTSVRQRAQKAQKTTRSFMVGFRAAWQSFTQSPNGNTAWNEEAERVYDQLPASTTHAIEDLSDDYDYEDYDAEELAAYDEDFEEPSYGNPERPGHRGRSQNADSV